MLPGWKLGSSNRGKGPACETAPEMREKMHRSLEPLKSRTAGLLKSRTVTATSRHPAESQNIFSLYSSTLFGYVFYRIM